MNPAEAEMLSTKMLVTWSNMRIPPAVWEEVFTELDYGTAGTTWARLARSNQHPPTVAEFVATYRSLPTAHNQPIPESCHHCGGDGFITCTEVVNGETYPNTFKACRCKNGENAQRQLDEARAFNDQRRGVHHLPGQEASDVSVTPYPAPKERT